MAESKYKFDYFQTETHVTLTILKKGVDIDNCKVTWSDADRFLSVYAGDEEVFGGVLAHKVDKTGFAVTCTPRKIEVRMPKVDQGRWERLCVDTHLKGDAVACPSFNTKNWDKLEKEVEKEEEEEPVEGDAAVNRMFQKIYKDADDDVRKAMMKSYSESGGTVLSTNWEEIAKKKTEVRPPDCMEYKKFES